MVSENLEKKQVVGRLSYRVYDVNKCPVCGEDILKLELQDKRSGDYITVDFCEKDKAYFNGLG